MAARRLTERRGSDLIADLRARIAALEGGRAGLDGAARVLPFGVAAIDEALPWGGLCLGALHEVMAQDPGAGAGFAAWLLARLAGREGVVLWCSGARATAEQGDLYGPGIAAFRLDLARLVAVRGRNDREVLWAMEEGLRAGRLAAVLGEVVTLGLTASRRLQLAAERGGTTALVLRPRGAVLSPSAALTRWRLDAAPGPPKGLGEAPGGGVEMGRWRAELWRCRGGVPRRWLMEWCDETDDLTVAADPGERPVSPAADATIRRAG